MPQKPATTRRNRKVTPIVQGGKETRHPHPEGLSEDYIRWWEKLYDELAIVRHVTPSVLALLSTAARHAQAEAQARQFAAEAIEEGDRTSYLKCQGEARAESRGLRSALAALHVSGQKTAANSKTLQQKAALATRPEKRWGKEPPK